MYEYIENSETFREIFGKRNLNKTITKTNNNNTKIVFEDLEANGTRYEVIMNNQGDKSLELTFKDNKLHSFNDFPAKIEYSYSTETHYYYKEGELDRKNNEPAIISYHKGGIRSKEYFINGKNKRTDGGPEKIYYGQFLQNPSYVETYITKDHGFYCETIEIYYDENGVIIRESRFINEELNSNDGKPSFIGYYRDGSLSDIKYHKKGKLHNEHGKPALVRYGVNGQVIEESYYIDGIEYDQFKYLVKIGGK